MPACIRILAACAGLLAATAAAAAPVAEVVGLKGEALRVTQGRTSALALGQRLDEGDEVRSLSPGRVKLRFVDGSVMVVSDASALRIERFRGAAGAPRQASFVLDAGLISQTVAPSPAGSWTVRTSSVVTAVRGTQYVVEVRPDQTTDVAVQSGAVAVEPAPATRAHQTRVRSMGGRAGPVPEGVTPLLLDRRNVGTRCMASGECISSRPWSAERLQELNDRLSGV